MDGVHVSQLDNIKRRIGLDIPFVEKILKSFSIIYCNIRDTQKIPMIYNMKNKM